jgi:hypothetical protein
LSADSGTRSAITGVAKEKHDELSAILLKGATVPAALKKLLTIDSENQHYGSSLPLSLLFLH